jgi:hypothetical protein
MRERYHHVYGHLFGATLVLLRGIFRGPFLSRLSNVLVKNAADQWENLGM